MLRGVSLFPAMYGWPGVLLQQCFCEIVSNGDSGHV